MSADGIKVLKEKMPGRSKWMQLPRDVLIGHDVLGQLPDVCKDLRLGRSVLVVTGRTYGRGRRSHGSGNSFRTIMR